MLNNKPSPRPQLPNRQTQPRRLQAVAQVHDYTSALPAGDAELDGFVRGLAALNPALDRYVNRNVEEQSEANRRSTLLAGTATGHSVDNPQAALAAPIQAPSFVPPAFDAEYRQAYGTAVAQRAAIDTKAAIQTRYEAEKGTEGFNLDAFLMQNRAKALAGVQDPTMAGVLGSHIGEVEASIRASAHNEAVRKHEDDRLSTASKLTMRFTADMNPQQLAEHHFSSYVPQMRGLRVDPKQAASLLLNRVKALSDEGGGRPDLFAAFNERDSEGFSILDRNPQLADHIAAARNQAQRQRDAAQNEAKQPLIAQRLIGYDDDIRDTPERVTVERLTADVSSGDISAEKAASLWHQAQEELGRKGAKESLLLDADRGMLGYYDPKDQNKVLDEMLGAPAKAMWQAAVSGDKKQTTALAQVIMQRHSQTGATVPVDTLQRLVQTSVTNLPAAEGPSAKFMATAEVYRALAADPKYRSLYFKDDADQVMASFVKHLDANGDAKTAYAAAYRSIDPAFKEQARKRAEAPEMQDKIRGLATKYASGSTMWGWLGGNGRPENQHLLGGWAATEVRRVLEVNPDLTDKEMHEHIERKSAENFVLDTTTQLAIKVPPAMSGDLTQKALTAYSKSFGEALKAKGEFPEGTIVRYIPLNAEGLYDVQTWTGTRQKSVGQANLQDIVNWHRSVTTLSPEEGSQLAEVRRAIRNKSELPQVDPRVLAKGRSVGFFKDNELAAVAKVNRDQVLDRIRAVPDFGYGKPSNTTSPIPNNVSTKVDPKMTSEVALSLAASPVMARGSEHVGLANSLIAMREGVVLSAYQDPNPDAGMNIGAGYNLRANAKTVDSDLKRAGVPESRIADVKAGKASLTPDQAKRLIEVATPRYEAEARKSAEETAPGLWGRMTPQQRAVMVDIAYQVGDSTKFKKAWAALAAGQTEEFSNETRVFYKNKSGQMVEDTRARELRASMLAGVADWNSRVSLGAK